MRLLLLFAAVLLSATPSAAYKAEVAGWEIRHWITDRTPTGCYMSGSFQDGTRFSIVVTTKYQWALGLSNSQWTLRKDGTTDVAAYVDRKFVASGKATHLNSTTAVLPLIGAEPYRALQTGQRLDLQTPYGNLNFALTGTGKAMYAVLDCVDTLVGPAKAKTPGSDSAVSQAAATVLLANILNAAGITGYRLDPPKAGNDAVTFRLADGTSGVFRASNGHGPQSPDEAATSILGITSNACKGEFVSGKQTVPSTDGSIVRKLLTTCKVGDKAQVSETTIIRESDGFLIQLTHVLSQSTLAATMEGAGKERDALVNAAMRSKDLR